jgi:hypothetical protein
MDQARGLGDGTTREFGCVTVPVPVSLSASVVSRGDLSLNNLRLVWNNCLASVKVALGA